MDSPERIRQKTAVLESEVLIEYRRMVTILDRV